MADVAELKASLQDWVGEARAKLGEAAAALDVHVEALDEALDQIAAAGEEETGGE